MKDSLRKQQGHICCRFSFVGETEYQGSTRKYCAFVLVLVELCMDDRQDDHFKTGVRLMSDRQRDLVVG